MYSSPNAHFYRVFVSTFSRALSLNQTVQSCAKSFTKQHHGMPHAQPCTTRRTYTIRSVRPSVASTALATLPFVKISAGWHDGMAPEKGSGVQTEKQVMDDLEIKGHTEGKGRL